MTDLGCSTLARVLLLLMKNISILCKRCLVRSVKYQVKTQILMDLDSWVGKLFPFEKKFSLGFPWFHCWGLLSSLHMVTALICNGLLSIV
jgi:hypothetical protein